MAKKEPKPVVDGKSKYNLNIELAETKAKDQGLKLENEWHHFPAERDIELNKDFKTITFNFNRINVVQALAFLESLIQEDV